MTHEGSREKLKKLVKDGLTLKEIAETMGWTYEHTCRRCRDMGLMARRAYPKKKGASKYDVLLFCVQRHLNGIQTDKLQAMEGTGGSEKTVNAVFSDVGVVS